MGLTKEQICAIKSGGSLGVCVVPLYVVGTFLADLASRSNSMIL